MYKSGNVAGVIFVIRTLVTMILSEDHQENVESTSTRLGALGSALNHELMPFSLTDLPFLYQIQTGRVMLVLKICLCRSNCTKNIGKKL